jgi:hypothetical protein
MGSSFLIAAICASLPLDGTSTGMREQARSTYMGAHFVATTLQFILPTTSLYLVLILHLTTIACLIIDSSLVFYTATLLWSVCLIGLSLYTHT